MYKGKLHSGEVVAVKVQRPYVLETVSADLYIIRRLGLALRDVPQARPLADRAHAISPTGRNPAG